MYNLYNVVYYNSVLTYFPPALVFLGFPSGSVVKNLPANARDAGYMGFILRPGRCPGGENGNPLQYSCLENTMDR